jgi:hypothetical protein
MGAARTVFGGAVLDSRLFAVPSDSTSPGPRPIAAERPVLIQHSHAQENHLRRPSPPTTKRSKIRPILFLRRPRHVARHHPASSQRMDLLDHLRQKIRNPRPPHRMGPRIPHRRKAPPLLLARLPSSPTKIPPSRPLGTYLQIIMACHFRAKRSKIPTWSEGTCFFQQCVEVSEEDEANQKKGAPAWDRGPWKARFMPVSFSHQRVGSSILASLSEAGGNSRLKTTSKPLPPRLPLFTNCHLKRAYAGDLCTASAKARPLIPSA